MFLCLESKGFLIRIEGQDLGTQRMHQIRQMNVMNWESKRNDFLIWTRLCYANGAVYMLSWDRVSSLWFWLSNCLVF